MAYRIGTVYPCGSNKGVSSLFCQDSEFDMKHLKKAKGHIQQDYDKYVVNSPNILSNKKLEDMLVNRSGVCDTSQNDDCVEF